MRISHCGYVAVLVGLSCTALKLTSCSSTEGPASSYLPPGQCTTPNCTRDGGVVLPESGVSLLDADRYDGQRATLQGAIWRMKPPDFVLALFDQDIAAQMDRLTEPATVHVVAFNYDYTTTYTLTKGYAYTDLPMSPSGTNFPLMVEDIDGKNDIMNSMIGVMVVAGNDAAVALPAMPKKPLETILASVSPPIIIDPTKAQLVVTVHSSRFAGDIPIQKITVGPPNKCEAVVYDTATGWTRDSTNGTGPLGTAIVANMDADPFPGDEVSVTYDKGGSNTNTGHFPVAQGAVTRVFYRESMSP